MHPAPATPILAERDSRKDAVLGKPVTRARGPVPWGCAHLSEKGGPGGNQAWHTPRMSLSARPGSCVPGILLRMAPFPLIFGSHSTLEFSPRSWSPPLPAISTSVARAPARFLMARGSLQSPLFLAIFTPLLLSDSADVSRTYPSRTFFQRGR